MSDAMIVLTVIGVVYMVCQVCGKITKQFITPSRTSHLKEDYHCNECNVIQTYKTK